MKKALALILIATFLVSVAGCTPKSQYDKLMDQKSAMEKKAQALASDADNLKKTISARDMEIKDLKNQVNAANSKARQLESELAKAKAQIGQVIKQ